MASNSYYASGQQPQNGGGYSQPPQYAGIYPGQPQYANRSPSPFHQPSPQPSYGRTPSPQPPYVQSVSPLFQQPGQQSHSPQHPDSHPASQYQYHQAQQFQPQSHLGPNPVYLGGPNDPSQTPHPDDDPNAIGPDGERGLGRVLAGGFAAGYATKGQSPLTRMAAATVAGIGLHMHGKKKKAKGKREGKRGLDSDSDDTSSGEEKYPQQHQQEYGQQGGLYPVYDDKKRGESASYYG